MLDLRLQIDNEKNIQVNLKRLPIILCIFLLSGKLAGQTPLPDSILAQVNTLPRDSTYVLKLNRIASDYLKTDPAVSRKIAAHIIDLYPEINYSRGYARALTVMGNSYWYEGVYEFAQNYYLLAARQYQILNDSIGMGQVYNNIGEVNKRLGEFEKSLSYLLRSMELKKKDTTRDVTLYNIGEVYVSMGNLEEAKRYINESLAMALEKNNERVVAYNYRSIASMKVIEKKYEEALVDFNKAEKLWIALGETRSLIQNYQDVSYTYRKMGKLPEAIYYLEKALARSKQINVPDLRVHIYEEFARIDSIQGNYKQAFYYLWRHNALKDSVYNLLKVEQIARVQTIYETEIRDRENEQLKAEKALRDTQLKSQKVFIVIGVVALMATGVMTWFLFRQRKKILIANQNLQAKNEEINYQKDAIEIQAAALLRLNQNLQELNKTLEGRIDENTQQLLLQNQKLAEYTFINAHKLRAPVASVLGLINLMQQATPEERLVILEHLKTCSNNLDSIIREISRNLESAMLPE